MVASNLVLIAGAGDVGRTVLDQLRAQDVPVRAMVRRDDDRAAELRALGAEVVLGDLIREFSLAGSLLAQIPPEQHERIGEEIAAAAAGGDPDGQVRLACEAVLASGAK